MGVRARARAHESPPGGPFFRYLATFQDPLKVILGTSIHKEAKVIVTRKYVVGGRSLITPEHAPARTVSIQEDAREVMMTRYGGDIEMNLNLFLRPGDAREELALKVGAQRRELERTLIEHGYAAAAIAPGGCFP